MSPGYNRQRRTRMVGAHPPVASRDADAAPPRRPLRALIGGDVPALVESLAGSLPAAGYRVTRAVDLMDLAARAATARRRHPEPAYDLVALVLSQEAWTYVALIEALVHEVRHVPIVVFTDGAAHYAHRLEALGVPVVEHMPFEQQGGGLPLTPASADVAGGGRVGRSRVPKGAEEPRGVARSGNDREPRAPVPAGLFAPLGELVRAR